MASELTETDMLALSVRQPWAELIMRGVKTVEVRSKPTNVRGRVLVYVAKRPADQPASEEAVQRLVDVADSMEVGVVVGSVEIVGCRELTEADTVSTCLRDFPPGRGYAWLLSAPKRLREPVKPERHPQPVFFHPFAREIQ